MQAINVVKLVSTVALLPDDQRCKYPNCNKGRYQEGHRTHDFCGIKHAREYERGKAVHTKVNTCWIVFDCRC